MRSLLQNRKHHGFPSALRVGLLAVTLGLAAPALAAGGGGGGGGGGGAGGGASGSPEVETKPDHGAGQTDLTTCDPGQVWDAKKHKCLQRRSGVLPI